MKEITLSQLGQVIEHVTMAMQEPIMVIGPSGAGKTETIIAIAEKHHARLCTILLGQYDTVDLKGSPWVMDIAPDGEDAFNATVWQPATTLPFEGNPRFPRDQPIFLFLDEITSATVPVMGVCYQLVNERRVGEFKLMDNVFIVCAGNRESDKGIVNRMPLPLCNRMTWFEIRTDVDVWCRWAQRAGLPQVGIAFMQWQKTKLSTFDPAKPEKVFASPRTWVKALRYYASPTMPNDIKMAAMNGAIGEGVSAEFWGFVQVWQKVAAMMAAITKDPLTAPLPTEPSLQYAVAISISGALTKANAPKLYAYLSRMAPEFIVVAWQLAISRDPALYETDEFIKFGQKYKAAFT